eukprot:CAMPEP_0202858458 /NCGR_PEP_ID=MMETSP1391-20130828/984_1 /ASSEMBLY_ACC=CAM_ASM_000867 /TAXON_ID=1034604 /ORGANISM="Chlamydomonas leiostraca, Strain SAG 11-49" /LENGTH=159 /DNA_ID=CAMNT_0049537381 /DNA_START=63 /DNA_END=542 /DNA_ORIENTATION=-
MNTSQVLGATRQRASLLSHAPRRASVVVRASELKKPELKRPEAPKQPEESKKLFQQDAPATSTPASVSAPEASTSSKTVTVEYQRQRAKEMTKYFNDVKLEKLIVDSKVFGWTPANEINNGRWVMMGFAIGLLTEYATGVDFIHQLALMVSYLGIADLD